MARTDFSQMECSIARTLEVIGERWSLLIVRDAMYGVRRFDDFAADLGVARNVLTDRLGRLVEHGVMERRQYEDRPPRYEYRLTEKGKDLFPVLLSMVRWGDRWATDEAPPVTLTHTVCGQVTSAVPCCSACGRELRWSEVRSDPIRIRVPARD
jgi:DNA-binding HxlR family transcriptional regulator